MHLHPSSSLPCGCIFPFSVYLLFSILVTDDSRACVAEVAQSLAISSPDAADAYLDLRLDSGDDADEYMAPKDGGSKKAANSSGAPKGRAQSAREKNKAAVEKRLATMRRNKQAEAAANDTGGASEPGFSTGNTSTDKTPATSSVALMAAAAAAAAAALEAPSTNVADDAALPPVAGSPPARGEAPSMPNAQSPRRDAVGSVALTDAPPPSAPPPLAATADAPTLPSTPPTTSGVVAAAFEALTGGKEKDVVDVPPASKRASGVTVAEAPLEAPKGAPPATLHNSPPSKSPGAPPGGHLPAPAAETASTAIGRHVPPASLTPPAGGRTSSSSFPPPPSAGAGAAAVAGAQSAVDASAVKAQEALARMEAEAMRHRRVAAVALVEARRLRLLAQKQRAGLVPPAPLSAIGDPHDGLAAARGGARPAGDAAVVGGSGAAENVDDGKPVDDADDGAHHPPGGVILPVDVGGLGGDGIASSAVPADALRLNRPAPSSGAVPADQGLPAAKLAKKRRLWEAAFVDWNLQFEDDLREAIIDIFVAAPGVYPSFILLYASGCTKSNPPATRHAITEWFSRQLSSAVCGAPPDEAPPLDRVTSGQVHAVISSAYHKLGNELPVSFVGSNDKGARKAAFDLPMRSSASSRADSSLSKALHVPPSTPETKKRKRGASGKGPDRRKAPKLGPGDTGDVACQDEAPDNKAIDGHDLTYRRMTVAARLYTEHYNVKRRSLPTPAAMQPLVMSESQLGVSTGSLNTIISSWRWGKASDKKTRVYDKLVELAKTKPGVEGDDTPRLYVVELLKVALKDKDYLELKRDREASSVRVPWEKWLADLVKVVPKLDALRGTGGGEGEEEEGTGEESVPNV